MDKYYARTRVNFVWAYPLKITAFQLMMLIDYYYYLLTELKTVQKSSSKHHLDWWKLFQAEFTKDSL